MGLLRQKDVVILLVISLDDVAWKYLVLVLLSKAHIIALLKKKNIADFTNESF